MAVVGGDLGEPDGLHVVLGLVDPGVGDLDRVDRHAVARDRADPAQRLVDGQRVARGVIQDVERLAIAGHLAHVLAEGPVVDLDPGQHEHPVVAGGDLEPVVLVDAVVVIGDGEEVVAELAVARDHLVDRTAAVRERRVGMEVALQQRHEATAPRSARGRSARVGDPAGRGGRDGVPDDGEAEGRASRCGPRAPARPGCRRESTETVHPESPYFVPPWVCPTNGSMKAGW